MSVWIWFFLGSIITGVIILILIIMIEKLDFIQAIDYFFEKRYFLTYIELFSVGLLPLLISVLCKDDFGDYGFRFKGSTKSIILSVIFAIIFAIIVTILTGGFWEPPDSFNLSFPWNIINAVLGFIAFGPLEIFFVVWLIENTDKIYQDEKKIVSSGFLITSIIFALVHFITSFGDVFKIIIVLCIILPLGLIYKSTNNIIGPVIAWTIINTITFDLVYGSLI